jgi:hypothetical protein
VPVFNQGFGLHGVWLTRRLAIATAVLRRLRACSGNVWRLTPTYAYRFHPSSAKRSPRCVLCRASSQLDSVCVMQKAHNVVLSCELDMAHAASTRGRCRRWTTATGPTAEQYEQRRNRPTVFAETRGRRRRGRVAHLVGGLASGNPGAPTGLSSAEAY